jgi:hypothetical protein
MRKRGQVLPPSSNMLGMPAKWLSTPGKWLLTPSQCEKEYSMISFVNNQVPCKKPCIRWVSVGVAVGYLAQPEVHVMI